MGLHYREKVDPHTEYIVWKVTESPDYFLNHLELDTEKEKTIYNNLNPKRQLEWLSSRYLISLLTSQRNTSQIVKNSFGQPELRDESKYISLSHTTGYASAIISHKHCGIDSQIILSKIERIKGKFLTLRHILKLPDIEQTVHLTIYWSMKEALYKANGKRQLDFKKHLFTQQLPIKLPDSAWSEGRIAKDGEIEYYQIKYVRDPQLVTAIALRQ